MRLDLDFLCLAWPEGGCRAWRLLDACAASLLALEALASSPALTEPWTMAW